jgi:hypothetical protein
MGSVNHNGGPLARGWVITSLSNRIFEYYTGIVDHCCDAWNKLIDQPERIKSVGMRQWADGLSLRFGITPRRTAGALVDTADPWSDVGPI